MPVELVVHQTVVSICLLVRMQPVDSGCLSSDMTESSGAGPQPTPLSSSSIIDLRGLQTLWVHLAPLPAISGQINRLGRPSTEIRVILKGLLPTSCHLVFHFRQRVHFLSIPSTLRCPSVNRLRTWRRYSSSLWSPSASSPVVHRVRDQFHLNTT